MTTAYARPQQTVTQAIFTRAANLDRFGIGMLRLGLVVVLVWIGALKFARYEADGIVPFIANSPLMSFFYHRPAPEYKPYMNKEGELNPAHRAWHEANNTYPFANGLGIVIISIGVLIAFGYVWPQVGAIGSGLLILMSLTTLSFLITTPEVWVSALGGTAHGFPYLAGPGRLVIKDAIMLGGAFVTLADSARRYLQRR